MATKKEIEIKLKYTMDGKGVEEAKQKIESLDKSTDQLDKGSQKAVSYTHLYGCFVSSGRVTPDLPDEQQAVACLLYTSLNRAGTISPSASSSVTFSDSILIPGKSLFQALFEKPLV